MASGTRALSRRCMARGREGLTDLGAIDSPEELRLQAPLTERRRDTPRAERAVLETDLRRWGPPEPRPGALAVAAALHCTISRAPGGAPWAPTC